MPFRTHHGGAEGTFGRGRAEITKNDQAKQKELRLYRPVGGSGGSGGSSNSSSSSTPLTPEASGTPKLGGESAFTLEEPVSATGATPPGGALAPGTGACGSEPRGTGPEPAVVRFQRFHEESKAAAEKSKGAALTQARSRLVHVERMADMFVTSASELAEAEKARAACSQRRAADEERFNAEEARIAAEQARLADERQARFAAERARLEAEQARLDEDARSRAQKHDSLAAASREVPSPSRVARVRRKRAEVAPGQPAPGPLSPIGGVSPLADFANAYNSPLLPQQHPLQLQELEGSLGLLLSPQQLQVLSPTPQQHPLQLQQLPGSLGLLSPPLVQQLQGSLGLLPPQLQVLPPMQQPGMPQAAAQRPRARGARASEHQSIVDAIHDGKRGRPHVIHGRSKYHARRNYTWQDICNVGEMIGKKEIKLCDLDRLVEDGPFPHKVPRDTMKRWLRDDVAVVESGSNVTAGRVYPGWPHWKAERERGRTSLSKPGGVKGGGSRLGEEAEKRLMGILSRAALSSAPYRIDEVEEMIRQTAVDAKLNVHKTGKPYTMTTNVRELLEGFLRRCREEGIFLLCKEGRPLSIARANAGTMQVLQEYTKMM